MANDTSPIDIQKYLKGVNYPCSKQELVEAAKREGAPENVLGVLNAMKDGQYETPADVMKAIGNPDAM